MYQKYFKRLIDIIISLFLIILMSPVMVIIFFLVWFLIGFPIFTQKRPGLKNKIFTLYKFKTLYDASKNISEKKRQNKLGSILRKTGLDELPQLFNILENNMSFVGPRPLLIGYLKKYSNFEKKRHLVKPGITGLSQITPQKLGPKFWKKSVEMDVYYVKNISFLSDMQIILKTIKLIILNRKPHRYFKRFNG